MSTPSNNDSTTNALLEALSNLTVSAPVINYRVFYDVMSKICIFKSIEEPPPLGTFVEVTAEEYDRITFCPQWFISDNHPELIPVDASPTIMLERNNSANGWTTIKDNAMFRVDLTYPEKDVWVIRSTNKSSGK